MKCFLVILLTAVLLLTCAAAETDSSQKQYVQAWHLVLNGEYRQAGTAFEKSVTTRTANCWPTCWA